MLIAILTFAAYVCLIAFVCLCLKRHTQSEYPFTEPPTRVSYNGRTYLTGMTDDGYQQIELDPVHHDSASSRPRPRLVDSRRD